MSQISTAPAEENDVREMLDRHLSADDPRTPKSYAMLADRLRKEYMSSSEPNTLTVAVMAMQHAVKIVEGPVHPAYLANLAALFNMRFELLKNREDIDAAVSTHVRALEAVEAVPASHPMRPALIDAFSDALLARFKHFGGLGDVDRAILAKRHAIELVTDVHPSKAVWLSTLGQAFSIRYRHLGEPDDIRQAVEAQRRSIELTSEAHPHRAGLLNDFGVSLAFLYDRLGQSSDLDEAISACRNAVELADGGHPSKAMFQSSLGGCLEKRFDRLGSFEDLEEGITVLREAVEFTPATHPARPKRLNNLALALRSRFGHLGRVQDLEDAIATQRQAVDHTSDFDLTVEGEAEKLARYVHLSRLLLDRFDRFDDPQDLEDAHSATSHTYKPASNDHYEDSAERSAGTVPVMFRTQNSSEAPMYFYNYGRVVHTRFKRYRALPDLQNAVITHRRASELTPEGHSMKPTYLVALGSALYSRHERLGDSADLTDAISTLRLALELIPDGRSKKPNALSILGNALDSLFIVSGNTNALDNAIRAHSSAIELTPEGHSDLPWLLSNLGVTQERLFTYSKKPEVISEAILIYRRAVELTPDGHTDRALYLTNLGNALHKRFSCLNDFADLEEGISVKQCAIELTPAGHSHKPVLMFNITEGLRARFEHDSTQSNFEAAAAAYEAAMAVNNGIPTERGRAVLQYIDLLAGHREFGSLERLLDAHSYLIGLLPELAWIGHSIDLRYGWSRKFASWVGRAVSVAITAERLDLAVSWLDTGRAVVWAQLHSLRTPLNDLLKQHPNLANELQVVRQQLQVSGNTPFSVQDTVAASRTFRISSADRHRHSTIHYERILTQIRNCAGFEDFLRPKSFKSLISFSTSAVGPETVIFINVHSSHCDALILSLDGSLKTVSLPGLTEQRATKLSSLWQNCLSTSDSRVRGSVPSSYYNARPSGYATVLGRLWEWIVSPILQSMDLLADGAREHLPHIVWCPTGPLTQLPLHAAGVYSSSQRGPRIFDYVVSSYTPSLSALAHCYERAETTTTVPNVLILTQPATPGQSPLPSTTSEGERLCSILPSKSYTLLEHEKATVQSTLAIINQHSWIHFACHGSQNLSDPTQSAFALFDGPLTLSALMSTTSEKAEMAFLSACQTAAGDATIPEESAHLAAGMLAIGFKGVVATMWSIKDEDGPVVVEAYYKKLIELRSTGAGRKGETGAAYALHEAVRCLREKVGEEHFDRWAPFVHFGV